MAGPLKPLVKGEFYINDVTDDFYLYEELPLLDWYKKGRLMRANVAGLVSEWFYPFTNGQVFEMAPGQTPTHFYPSFSLARSIVRCDVPALADCQLVLTDSLSNYLGKGKNIICTADFTPASQTATLTFNDAIVAAGASLWLVMPSPADQTLSGLNALFAGEAA
jgi:hypothetical protein